jgi:hypothetical protein
MAARRITFKPRLATVTLNPRFQPRLPGSVVGAVSIGGVAAIFKLASLLPERVIFAYGDLDRGAAALSFHRLSFQELFAAAMAILAARCVPREGQLPSREAFAENGN